MTLVVGRTFGKNLTVLADTSIHHNGQKLPREMGRIKTTLLAEKVSVSFAGSPDLAGRALSTFQHFGTAPYDQTIEHFLRVSRIGGVEFLLGFAGPAKLVRIQDGEMRAVVNSYIGDQAAFSSFQAELRSQVDYQRLILALPDAEINAKQHDALETFMRMIETRRHPSCSDFLSCIVCCGYGFEFVRFTCNLMGPDDFLRLPNGSALSVPLGEFSTYRFETIVPTGGPPWWFGFNYPHPKICYIFGSDGSHFPRHWKTYRGLTDDGLLEAFDRDGIDHVKWIAGSVAGESISGR